MMDIIPRLDEETLIFLGTAGSGKTPAQYIMGFAMSRYRLWELGEEGMAAPSVRVCNDFDQCKNEEGTPRRSTIFDDGDLDRMAARKTKAFFDARKKAALSKERYTGAKFVLKEFRSAADNKVDLGAEDHMTVDGKMAPLTINYTGTSYASFVKMVRPAFPKDALDTDIEAVLKRATVIVNTKHDDKDWWCYVCPAGTSDSARVKRYEMSTPTYITRSARETLSRWTKTGALPDADVMLAKIKEEQDMFRASLRGSDIPPMKAKSKEEKEEPKATKNEQAAPSTATGTFNIKLERTDTSPVAKRKAAVWGKRASILAQSGPIDLGTPSPKQARVTMNLSQKLSQMIGKGIAQGHVGIDTGARGSAWTAGSDDDGFPAVGAAEDGEQA